MNQSAIGKLKISHACISSNKSDPAEIMECAENYCIF